MRKSDCLLPKQRRSANPASKEFSIYRNLAFQAERQNFDADMLNRLNSNRIYKMGGTTVMLSLVVKNYGYVL